MNLRDYLRNEWSQYIRPLVVKSKCDFCGCEENLHLHHIDRFHNLLVETLEELHLQELNTEFYDEFELKQISNFMLAKQLKSEYKTLCESCHMKLHNKEKYNDEYKKHYYNPNGRYFMVNTTKMLELDISPAMFYRFMMICCNCNYDGILINKKRKVDMSKIKNNDIVDNIIGVEKAEMYTTINYLKDMGLIYMVENTLSINKKYVSKGFNNYNTTTKVFIDNLINIGKNVNSRSHKLLGNLLLLSLSNNSTSIFDLENSTNTTVIKNKLNSIPNLCNFLKNEIFINPNLIYSGGLDFSYKEIIDEYSKRFERA